MAASRREKIEALLKDEPGDVFLRYSLALELEGEGRWEEGLEILEDLSRGTPPYVPAFHMAARHLVARGKVDDARRALREGIDAARSQGESHAAAEMSELLMSLGELGEG
ncbi:MAG: tetratricopeptide repeat protein [Planctomycetaceae bacterium]